MGKRILVIAAGDRSAGGAALREPFDLVIAADGGLDWAQDRGIGVDVAVGDLDSASEGALARANEDGVELEAHPAEKDHTDLELALQRALHEHPDQIHVVGGSGGRPDHWLTNLSLLAGAAHAGPAVEADFGEWTASVVVPNNPYSGEAVAGELFSLVPIGGDAGSVTTSGLTYPLDHEDLQWRGSRGVSNISCGGPVRVRIEAGSLLVFRRRHSLIPPPAPIEGVNR